MAGTLIGADLQRMADAYPPEAAHTPAEERERYFTAEQRAAWDLRFSARVIASDSPAAGVATDSPPRRIFREPYHG